MSGHQDIFITDLKEAKTCRNPQTQHLGDYHFQLSAKPTSEWTEIFREKLFLPRTPRNALMDASIHDKSFFKGSSEEVWSVTLGLFVDLG